MILFLNFTYLTISMSHTHVNLYNFHIKSVFFCSLIRTGFPSPLYMNTLVTVYEIVILFSVPYRYFNVRLILQCIKLANSTVVKKDSVSLVRWGLHNGYNYLNDNKKTGLVHHHQGGFSEIHFSPNYNPRNKGFVGEGFIGITLPICLSFQISYKHK